MGINFVFVRIPLFVLYSVVAVSAGGADGAGPMDTAAPPVEDAGPKPQPLHLTQSIFLRNVAPTITQQEVEALCRKYPGYMRVAIQEPQPERRFARRGWVTFDRHCNVKDVCFALNNIRVRAELYGTVLFLQIGVSV